MSRVRPFLCVVAFHRSGFVRHWWEGQTLNALYRCERCGQQRLRKIRT